MWWLGMSQDELKAASTCRSCGNSDADIDIGLCFDCFTADRLRNKERRFVEDERQCHAYFEQQYMLSLGFDPIALGM